MKKQNFITQEIDTSLYFLAKKPVCIEPLCSSNLFAALLVLFKSLVFSRLNLVRLQDAVC